MADDVEELALLSLILLYGEEQNTSFKQSLSLYFYNGWTHDHYLSNSFSCFPQMEKYGSFF